MSLLADLFHTWNKSAESEEMSEETPRLLANYKAYVEMAAKGVPAAAIALAFEEGDIEAVQDKVMKTYWAHVRSLLRSAPVFMRKLDFLSSFLERPVEDILDAIATAHFAEITLAVAQKNHNKLREWINELYSHAQDQLRDSEEVISEQAYDAEMRTFTSRRR